MMTMPVTVPVQKELMPSRLMPLLMPFWSRVPTKAPKASYVIGKTGKSHVRTGPGLSYKEVGVLHKEETATYLGEQSTDERGVVWYKIRWKGEERWVSSKYTELHE